MKERTRQTPEEPMPQTETLERARKKLAELLTIDLEHGTEVEHEVLIRRAV